ncbi:hypothetical protein CDO52_05555 [Nocardiopsis gilva YIM 90087]|uniref:Uncharacterized protein n=1 Tax=Nocardiopsis gilva YIM 90087 TaxID=1235441 RepID=A0A223S2G9_9ACTN|nr:hypothetical protein CDO52_05555 [Nocardiopsis gilva YIM 90087]
MSSFVTRARHGDVTVAYDSSLPPLQQFTVRGLGGRIVCLRSPYNEAHRALVRECGLSKAEASRLLDKAVGADA